MDNNRGKLFRLFLIVVVIALVALGYYLNHM